MNYGLALQNPLDKHSIDEVTLNVVHHTPQQLKEVLPRGLTKKKSLHKIPTTVINSLQVGNGNPETMKVNIRNSSTPKVHRIKVIIKDIEGS